MSTEIEVVPLVLGRNKEPKPTSTNVAIVLAALGDAIRYEAHSRRIVCGGIGSTFPAGVWIDNHTTALVQLCEARGIDASPSTVDRAVALHAHRHRYNALTDFLMQCALEWDDVARLDAALCTYWHAEDTEATRITSRVFLLSLAARGLEPGCKVDTCVAFVGDQGERKSSALAALVGKQWFSDSPLPIGDKDGMQNLPGKWLWEFGENASLSRREVEQVKQFLSTQQDHYRASYGRHAETVLRQICFAASTNKIEYLTDPTGNRRHLPVSVSDIDLAGIERDRLQLIGEAAARVLSEERYWLSKDESAVLDAVRDGHTERDPWEEPIAAWLEQRAKRPAADTPTGTPSKFRRPAADLPFSTLEAYEALRDPQAPRDLTRVDCRTLGRVSNVLRGLGYEKRKESRRAAERGVNRWHRKA